MFSFLEKKAMQFARTVSPISPLKLFRADQDMKLAGTKSFVDHIHTLSEGASFGEKAERWWNGHYLDSYAKGAKTKTFSDSYMKRVEANKFARRATVGLLGGATVGTVALGEDNPVSKFSSAAVGIGGSALAAGGLVAAGKKFGMPGGGKAAGAGLIALTAYNFLQRGDQIGPL